MRIEECFQCYVSVAARACKRRVDLGRSKAHGPKVARGDRHDFFGTKLACELVRCAFLSTYVSWPRSTFVCACWAA